MVQADVVASTSRASFVRRFARNRGAVIATAVFGALVLACLLAPEITSHNPIAVHLGSTMQPPSFLHPMGTDRFGRDVWTRVLYGGRVTLGAAVLAVLVACVLGIVPGLAAGYYGGYVDVIISRIVDIMLAFPGILLALVVVAILGTGIVNAMIAIGVSLAPSFVRLIRGTALSIRREPYVEAAIASGARTRRIVASHVLRNSLSPLIVLMTVSMAWAIIIGASLNFLGLGVQPPAPEWGADLAFGRDYLTNAWWISGFPGLMIMISNFSINLIGDALRDAL